MELDIQEIPIGGLVPPEQLQSWKDYNTAEIRLFSEIIFPTFNRFREFQTFDSDGFRAEMKTFFDSIPAEAGWRPRLIEELRDWIYLSRIESPGAEIIYRRLETIIEEDSLEVPRGSEEADESSPERRSPTTSRQVEMQ